MLPPRPPVGSTADPWGTTNHVDLLVIGWGEGGKTLVLGASLQLVHAEEVINLVALAIRHAVTAAELRGSIYTHTSATEALNEILGGLARL